ncbi:hypothetical protein [Blastopirellula marina]|uniref:Leucine Rich repeats (2 copies) n=1 Tax=Blastopirellula marina TaxID=124 RepID=A0A2S8FMR3_9BACT|nr:hypothetical protein [Blastopirellula marina]PQO33134.1 hypothetical protein C5Y98_18570 [Blastopirellula marina]PTL43301.1 hypothetical protein C5Y97_18580 [Blastopirellula marina]
MLKFWRFQFSTRMLIGLVAVAGLLLGIYWHLYVRETRLMAALERKRFVVFSQARFADAMPAWTHAWLPPKISHLEAACNSPGDITLINRCRELEYLSLCRSADTHITIELLGVFLQCKTLSFDGPLNDQDLKHIVSSFPSIEDLSLEETEVTDDGLAALARLTKLQRLSLNSHVLTETGLQHLRQVPSLHELTLYGAEQIDKETAISILNHRPCKVIRIGFEFPVLDAGDKPSVSVGFEMLSTFGCLDIVVPVDIFAEQE